MCVCVCVCVSVCVCVLQGETRFCSDCRLLAPGLPLHTHETDDGSPLFNTDTDPIPLIYLVLPLYLSLWLCLLLHQTPAAPLPPSPASVRRPSPGSWIRTAAAGTG